MEYFLEVHAGESDRSNLTRLLLEEPELATVGKRSLHSRTKVARKAGWCTEIPDRHGACFRRVPHKLHVCGSMRLRFVRYGHVYSLSATVNLAMVVMCSLLLASTNFGVVAICNVTLLWASYMASATTLRIYVNPNPVDVTAIARLISKSLYT